MPKEANYLDIMLLGKEYRVACPPAEHDALLNAVTYVDEKMHEIAEKTKSNISERIAVMAALNIAHEHLSQKHPANEIPQSPGAEIGLDFGTVKRRISAMEARLEAVLAPQDKLL
ncbi:cell division protein ZapA [Propionivibrio sp.]|uniref:cell division protein ZapA n=1 Tax=Propionivibrio sp. TaxID=2212460 RepID=UPI002606A2BB|nr:cell division protein ZapA [Propionivibrio sp.]